MKSDKLLTILTSILFLGGVLTIGWVVYKSYRLKTATPQDTMECVQASQLHSMRQPDMGALLEKNQQYKILVGYYDCNPIERGDLVAFLVPDAERPVVRVVRGLPGDQIEVRAVEGDKWEVLVNGDPAFEPNAQVMWTPPTASPLLQEVLLKQDNILRENEYLVLAVSRLGEADSLSLGPTAKTQITGKIMVLPPSEP